MIENVLRVCAWCGKNVHMVTHTEHRELPNHRDPVNGQSTHVFTKYRTCPSCKVTSRAD